MATPVCLKCKLEKNNCWFVEGRLNWDVEKYGCYTFWFCQDCQDLTNKVDKLQLILEELYTRPQYTHLRHSVPPPAVSVAESNCNAHSKSGPSPPDLTPSPPPPSNDNTTLEDYKKLLEKSREGEDMLRKQLGEVRNEASDWKKSWEQEYENKTLWKGKYEESKELREKYKTLKEEYEGVYKNEFKQKEERVVELEAECDRKEWELQRLQRIAEERWKEVSRLEEEKKVSEEKTAILEREVAAGETREGTLRGWLATANERYEKEKQANMTLFNNQVKQVKEIEKLEEENKKLREGICKQEDPPKPPGWYPCPRPYTWHPERKRWEREDVSDIWWTLYDSHKRVEYLSELK